MTNKLTPFAFLILLIGCGTPENTGESTDNLLENLQITTDTVMVDVGEEIFNAGMYYQFAKVDQRPIVYFSLNQLPEVHEIDLETMRLSRRILLEKDGPNRAPRYIQYFDLLPSGEFVLADYATQGVYTQSGEKILSFQMEPDQFEGLDEDLTSLYFNLHMSPNKTKVISTPTKSQDFISKIALVNLEAKTGKLVDLPALELTKNFRTNYSFENGSSTYGDFFALQKIRNQLFISSGSTSDIYIYDFATEALVLKSFDHQLVPVKKTGEFPAQVDSQERVQEIGEEIRKQVSFNRFFWDDSRKQYIRFATKSNGKDEEGKNKKSDVYLFIYDENLNLLGETALDWSYPPFRAFFHQGKLYSYTVVEENPGFIVYDFNF